MGGKVRCVGYTVVFAVKAPLLGYKAVKLGAVVVWAVAGSVN